MFSTYDEAGVYLGVLDTVFMICYSVGLYLSGWIGERVEVCERFNAFKTRPRLLRKFKNLEFQDNSYLHVFHIEI